MKSINDENKKHTFYIDFNGTEKIAMTYSEKLIKSILPGICKYVFLVLNWRRRSKRSRRRSKRRRSKRR